MRRAPPALFLVILCALLPPAAPAAQDLSLSLGTWSRPADAKPGAFIDMGATLGLGKRLEIGAAAIARITPSPLEELLLESHLGISLYGDRLGEEGLPGIYANGILDLGAAARIEDPWSGPPEPDFLWFGRFTPLALGNPYYGRRDRFFSLSVLADPKAKTLSVSFSLLKFDFYILRPRRGR